MKSQPKKDIIHISPLCSLVIIHYKSPIKHERKKIINRIRKVNFLSSYDCLIIFMSFLLTSPRIDETNLTISHANAPKILR